MPTLTLGTTIAKYMTQSPLRIEETTTVAQAAEIMAKGKFRHLPVTKKRKLTGLISMQLLRCLIDHGGLDPKTTQVGSVMDHEPFKVRPTDTLSNVVQHLAKHKLNYAVVVDNEEVIGIFTEVDAYRIISDTCQESSKYSENAA